MAMGGAVSNESGAKTVRTEVGNAPGPAWTQDRFADRHIGPDAADVDAMLRVLGHKTLDGLIDAAVPPSIRTRGARRICQVLFCREHDLVDGDSVFPGLHSQRLWT
jgi:hypothetical protein